MSAIFLVDTSDKYLQLNKGTNSKVVRVENADWDYARHEDGSPVTYFDNGEEFMLFVVQYTIEEIIK